MPIIVIRFPVIQSTKEYARWLNGGIVTEKMSRAGAKKINGTNQQPAVFAENLDDGKLGWR